MSTIDKVVNYGFVIIFVIVFGLAIVGHIRLTLKDPNYDTKLHYFIW